jgi:hypothetical protein
MAKVMRGLSLLRSSSRIVRESTTYTLEPAMSEAEALAYWMGHDKETVRGRTGQRGLDIASSMLCNDTTIVWRLAPFGGC